jgi:cytochrome P450
MGNVFLLIVGGNDTTRNSMSGGLHAMITHPGEWQKLRHDPSLISSLVPEIIRWQTPVLHMRRTATRDTELGGQKISAGDKVLMYFGAANRDPARFERADQLNLARSENDHLAFGAGAHACLGQHIARIEIDAMLREVLTRMDDFQLTAPPEWLASNFISGPRVMPVRFKAG